MSAEILSLSRMGEFADAVRKSYAAKAVMPVPEFFTSIEMDKRRLRALEVLGDRWLLHPKHSPKKGNYDGWPKK
jgi:hypothetical protein